MTQIDLDAIELRERVARETYHGEWEDAVTKMDALSDSVRDVAPLVAEVRRLHAAVERVRGVVDEWASTDPDAPNHDLWRAVAALDTGEAP